MRDQCKTIMLIVGVSFVALRCQEDIQPIGVAVYEIRPAGGPPGTSVRLTGVNFNRVPEKNVVTIDGQVSDVLSASDTLLTVQLPEQASFGTNGRAHQGIDRRNPRVRYQKNVT